MFVFTVGTNDLRNFSPRYISLTLLIFLIPIDFLTR